MGCITNHNHITIEHRYPDFYTKKDMAKVLNCSTKTIDNYVSGLQEQIEQGRYSRYAVCGRYISFYALMDYMKYRDQLSDKNMKKYVPPFNPAELQELCGIHSKVVNM